MITKTNINVFLVFIVSLAYASVYLSKNYVGVWDSDLILSVDLNRPWVYRQLVPLLARLISALGVAPDLSIALIVTLSGVGLYVSLRRLALILYGNSDTLEVIVVVSVFLGMLLFGYKRLHYDLMTAFLFTLAPSLLLELKYDKYALLFPLICLNRETSFLLVLFWFVIILEKISFEKIWLFLYQVFVWLGIRLILNTVFSNNGGADAWIEPLKNVGRFINNPLTTILHFFITAVLLYLVIKDWKYKPRFFKIAFMVFAPLLTSMYFVMGQAFEVRVFWEIYPVIVILSYPTIVELSKLFVRNSETLLERA
jgi:hypothetical protein